MLKNSSYISSSFETIYLQVDKNNLLHIENFNLENITSRLNSFYFDIKNKIMIRNSNFTINGKNLLLNVNELNSINIENSKFLNFFAISEILGSLIFINSSSGKYLILLFQILIKKKNQD